MKTNLIKIGNSRGVRIPKPYLEASGMKNNIEMIVKKGEIRLIATKEPEDEIASLSEAALEKEWNTKEEDEAWKNL